MIVRYLVNCGRDCHLRTIFEGNLNVFSAINEDQNDGCCLVQAINSVDGSSLDDRCFKYYHLHYKYRDHSYRRVAFTISESYREIGRVFPIQRYSSYRVLVFPNFAAIARPEYCTKWVLSEEEPLEDIMR